MRVRVRRSVSVLAASCLVAAALPYAAASTRADDAPCTRFAALGGDDAGPGTARRPFRTVQHLADSLQAGATGCLARGVYRDVSSNGYALRVNHGGAPRAPLTIRSAPGSRATLVGTIYVPRGSDDVTLSRLTIVGIGGQNTVKVDAADVTIEDSEITNGRRGDSCLILGDSSGYGEAASPVVRRNRFHDCGRAGSSLDHAIYVNNTTGGRIVDNLFWNQAGYAVHLYPQARGTLVAHNVIDGGGPSVRGGVLFGGDSVFSSNDNVVERNVIAYARTYNLDSWWGGDVGTGNVARENCLWGGAQGNVNGEGGGFATDGNVVADPLFVDRRRHDYRLRTASPCRRTVRVDVAALLRRR